MPANVCLLICMYLCMCTLSSFPPWPLSPDVSAWEQRRTIVTKSQRAIAWGGATSVCHLTGLGFIHPVISSACLLVSGWVLWMFQVSSLTVGYGSEMWGRKWKQTSVVAGSETCHQEVQQCWFEERGGVQLYNVLFWYCITGKGWEYPGMEIIPRKLFPSGHTVQAKQRTVWLQSWWKTD